MADIFPHILISVRFLSLDDMCAQLIKLLRFFLGTCRNSFLAFRRPILLYQPLSEEISFEAKGSWQIVFASGWLETMHLHLVEKMKWACAGWLILLILGGAYNFPLRGVLDLQMFRFHLSLSLSLSLSIYIMINIIY